MNESLCTSNSKGVWGGIEEENAKRELMKMRKPGCREWSLIKMFFN